MYQTYYLALGLFAGVITLAWLFIEERVTVTAFLSMVSWALLAVLGGSVDVMLDNGAVEPAPVPDTVRWLLFGLALLSFIALALYQLGVYPPDTGEPYHETQTNG
jgi:hypothetical protein